MISISRLSSSLGKTDRMKSGECWSGQLTDPGKVSLKKSGANMRGLYVDSLGFLPKVLDARSSESVRVRSTEYARTIESVQYLFNGIYPKEYRETDHDLPIHLELKGETMYPASSEEANTLQTKLRNSTVSALQPLLHDLTDRMKKIGISMTPDIHSAHVLTDYLMCAKGSGVKPPAGITDKDMADLESLTVRSM
jgi:acid phosphatase